MAPHHFPVAEPEPQVFPYKDHKGLDKVTLGVVVKGGHLHPPFRGLTPPPKGAGGSGSDGVSAHQSHCEKNATRPKDQGYASQWVKMGINCCLIPVIHSVFEPILPLAVDS